MIFKKMDIKNVNALVKKSVHNHQDPVHIVVSQNDL